MKYLGAVLLVLSLLAFANPARAHFLSAASATDNCNGFNFTETSTDLTPGVTYTVDFTFTLTGPLCPSPVSGVLTFTATSATQTESETGSWPGAPLDENCVVTGTATLTSSGSTLPITIIPSDQLACAGTGCPATFGFWKHHSFPSDVQTSGLTIGGVHYTAAQLETVLTTRSGGNSVTILGHQLIAALLNLEAGAKDNPTADAAIAAAEGLLQSNSLNLLSSNIDPSSPLGTALVAQSQILDGFNNADFHTCSEGSGLQ